MCENSNAKQLVVFLRLSANLEFLSFTLSGKYSLSESLEEAGDVHSLGKW